MNERIRQLSEQAKLMAEEDINRQISYNTELKAFAEKFAELIVRECMCVVEDAGGIDKYHYTRAISQHFGVTE
jgi:hypothetical protein